MSVETIRLPTGDRLGFRVLGGRPGDAPGGTFVCLAGLGSSSASLPAVLAVPGTSTIVIDRPGYAASTPRRYSPAGFADDTAVLLRHLDVRSAHVIGWSAGGLYAEHLARRHPTMVASLSRVSSAPPFASADGPDPELPEGWAEKRRQVRRRPHLSRLTFAAASFAALAPARALDASEGASAEDRKLLQDPRFRPGLIQSVREGWQRGGRAVFDDACALMTPMDTVPRDAPHPVRLWHGDADPVFPLSTMTANAALYRSASVTVLPGEGHLAYLRAWPDIVRAALAG